MKIGLVLSSGGARGFAHIGVLKVLEENNIKISEISGCSMGALIGAMYASGMPVEEIEHLALKVKAPGLRDFSFSFAGLFKADRIERELKKSLKVKTFEELNIPLSINAVDINSGEELVFRKGNLVKAIRASFSIPGAFIPAKHKGRILVDGGVVNPLPASNLRKSDFAIIVNVSTRKEQITSKSRIDKIAKQTLAIKEMKLIGFQLLNFKLPHYIIRPEISQHDTLKFKDGPKIILKGESAAREAIHGILKKIRAVEKPRKPSFLSEIFRKLFRKV